MVREKTLLSEEGFVRGLFCNVFEGPYEKFHKRFEMRRSTRESMLMFL